MRFGFSPGWLGRSPSGLGPCADYLMTRVWGMPQPPAYVRGWGPGFEPGPLGVGPFMGGMSREDELSLLRHQSEWLSGRVEAISRRIQELEAEEG
jgi:hypothetical protein